MKKLIVALLLLSPSLAMADQTIVQKNRRFAPGEVTIRRGESLTFTNDDEFIHQVYVDGLFDSEEKAPGEDLTQVFTNAGTFEVRCHIHPKMKLTVRVN